MLRAAADPSAWDTVKDYANRAEKFVDAPVYDAAAVLGVTFAWLSGLLFGMKLLSYGLRLEFRDRRR